MLIDLTKKDLPSTINVGGRSFAIKTCFRDWIAFGQHANTGALSYDDICKMFLDEIPPANMFDDIVEGIIAFYTASSSTPRSSITAEHEAISDLYEDGEYIFASFKAQYGINLLSEDLHWHEFKALLNCLRETKYNDVISYRAYQKSGESYEQSMMRLKEAWSLSNVLTAEEEKCIEEFERLFEDD